MREQVRSAALDALARLDSPDTIDTHPKASAARLGVPGMWHPLSISSGFPGIALGHLAAFVADPHNAEQHRRRLRLHLRHATTLVPAAASTSIMEGYGSLVTATVQTAVQTGDCRQFAVRGLTWLARLVTTVSHDVLASWEHGAWHDERQWDAVCGLAGAVRVLIAGRAAHLADHADHADHEAAIRIGLRVLVQLATATADRPGWWIPAGAQRRCPDGGADPGLAHGISGPLVTLAISHRHNLPDNTDGDASVVEAIAQICRWLLDTQQPDLRWPHTVPLDGEPGSPHSRSAWCYGAVGISRALYLAATATEDHALAATAVDTLAAITGDIAACTLSGPTICHGLSGLLHVVTRTARDSADPRLLDASNRLASLVLGMFDPGAPFGFRHQHDDPPGTAQATARTADLPGLLTGASGTAAALLSWAEPTTADVWDLPLLVG